MTKDEMRYVLSQHLARYRSWSYVQLAARIGEDCCLETVERTASDGTEYQMEFQVFWDDKPHGDVRVVGDLFAEPQRPLLGFIPIYTPDVTDCFIMSPGGQFVGE